MSPAHFSRSSARSAAISPSGMNNPEPRVAEGALDEKLVDRRRPEEQLQTVIDTIPALVWTAQANGAAEFVNQRWLDYTGLPIEQARGRGWAAAVHPDDIAMLVHRWGEIIASEQDGEVEARLRRFDGAYRWFWFRAAPLFDEHGKVVRWYGTNTDVEDRKRAEFELRRSERLLAAGEAVSHTGSGSWDLTTGQMTWSDEIFRMLGVNPNGAEASVELFLRRVHPDERASLAKIIETAINEKRPYSLEYRLVMDDGTIKHCHTVMRPFITDSGDVKEYVGVSRDITQRKRIEEALLRSEAFLAQAQRLTLTGSIWWKVSTGEITWSEESYRLMGYPRSVTPTVDLILQRCHPDDLALVQTTVARSARDGANMDFEHRLLMPDGSVKHLHVVLHNVAFGSRENEFVGAVSDITERKQAQEALHRSEQLARGQVEALIQNLDVLATGPGPDGFIIQMLSTIGRLLEARWVALWLLDESRDCMVPKAVIRGGIPVAADPENPFIKDPSCWKDDRALQELFRSRVPIVCEDIDADDRVLDTIREFFKAHGTKKFMRVPTLIGGAVKGFIAIHHGERGPYRSDEIELAQALAHQTMLAFQIGQTATLEERNRMARDIHDTLAQGLTAVIIQLQAAEDAKTKSLEGEVEQHLQSARDLARDSLNEARRSVQALRPQALEEGTFWDAIKCLIRNATAGTALQTSFHVRGKVHELSPPWQEHFLHIGQEALTNALKYAHARHFETRLTFAKDQVSLEFEDDGCGFLTTEPHDGSGLIGMRERVARIGATLTITSAPGRGTKVIVVSAFPAIGGS